jgi:hypothetical protein
MTILTDLVAEKSRKKGRPVSRTAFFYTAVYVWRMCRVKSSFYPLSPWAPGSA